MTTNTQRAERADPIIRQYGDDLVESNLIDLLADSMHWCDANREDFHYILAQACRHYVNELNDAQDDERRLMKKDTGSLSKTFDDYEISGVREYGTRPDGYCERVDDSEAQFWSLYGHIPGEGVECIGDFKTREIAEEVYARITGTRYGQRRKEE